MPVTGRNTHFALSIDSPLIDAVDDVGDSVHIAGNLTQSVAKRLIVALRGIRSSECTDSDGAKERERGEEFHDQ